MGFYRGCGTAIPEPPLSRDAEIFEKDLWEPRELLRLLVNANIALYFTALFIAPGAGVVFRLG